MTDPINEARARLPHLPKHVADLLAALADECERLRVERDEAKRQADAQRSIALAERTSRKQAEAECNALRVHAKKVKP